ncbi:hypothetical protein Srubr_32180 [Streptomyces rubradiris]|uniref:MftR C-terminal domain-containing protein n=1 Tax=Streptomyces rubradiris TaxID=285531 RepID=A0ABQ3RC26_STRRR|nr:hypothetical protein GCM10018792_01110 [Streptomyces rubradiris]GHI53372.1 hypothetical protein Srubr_32180 [Streptomyces rubradiris]
MEIIAESPRPGAQRLARRARWADLIRAEADAAEADAAVARGEAAPRDYRPAATAFIGSVNGLTHDWTAGWTDATLDEVVDEPVRLLLGMLRPEDWRPATRWDGARAGRRGCGSARRA